ncbi:tRNA nucleotidyltransferase/poly(A) polymerase [Ceraceosorus bombacis]|uniref:tRNA nucleotidyltransferase/poly(A) polymerase n=1 Tax=Ceraceosorus bombacis TaxID=401625 RepID=A0A0P1BLP1_9BASI|nr:tRNA nucleotidyltransferase/poly(A) polymerase [Ceraceosorus bombacis]
MPRLEQSSSLALSLSSQEDAIVALLADTCRWIEQNQPQIEPAAGVEPVHIEYHEGWKCEARIAGGWVRDKLISQPSSDLDVSLSSLTGHTYALLLSQYLQSADFASSQLAQHPVFNVAAGGSSKQPWLGSITRIEANPEQSKNLETATAVLAGLSLDFVNLRKEVYDGETRIPTMTFGTPLEDATRRDTTINSLFYNVHTRKVEDLTGMGITDLQEGIIRTPLEALQTFTDDPLRILRCVRFAARLGYRLDDGIWDCLESAQGEGVRAALRDKISRERVGIEVDKMLAGADPHRAIHLLHALGLYPLVFLSPLSEPLKQLPLGSTTVNSDALGGEATVQPAQTALLASCILDRMYRSVLPEALPTLHFKDRRPVQDHPRLELFFDSDLFREQAQGLLAALKDKEQRRRMFLAAALLPLRHAAAHERLEKWCWAGEHVIHHGLKLGKTSTREPLAALYRAADILEQPELDKLAVDHPHSFVRWIPHFSSRGVAQLEDKAIAGLLLNRQPAITDSRLGVNLSSSLLISMVFDLAQRGYSALSDASDVAVGLKDSDTLAPSPSRDLHRAVAQYVTFWHLFVDLWQLLPRAEERPRLDGVQIKEAIGVAPAILTGRIQKNAPNG